MLFSIAGVETVQQTASGLTRLQEFGLVGSMILVIVGFFGLLLRHVLNQAKEDRDIWAKQSEKFIVSQEKISDNMITVTMTLKEVTFELKSLREKVEKLESKNEVQARADRHYPSPRRGNGGRPEGS